MNVLIACDKFKGSLTATEVCHALASGINQVDHSLSVVLLPLADGGDGTLHVLMQELAFKQLHIKTTDALGRPIDAAWLSDGQTAYIELAEASGIQHLADNEFDILHTSTKGTGVIIKEAIRSGHKHIVLSIGGSCTNDLGIGILGALDFQFLNTNGETLDPIGANLLEISDIRRQDTLEPFQLTILCDVENLLYGNHGAAVVYGPQKGAADSDIEFLEKAAKQFSNLVKEKFDKDISMLKGGGAAGGIAAGLFGLLDDVYIKNGFEFITEKLDLTSKIKQADHVITGEGKFDSQSLQGKVVGKMIALCHELNTPISVVAGVIDLPSKQLEKLKLIDCFELMEMAKSLDDSKENASSFLKKLGPSFVKRP